MKREHKNVNAREKLKPLLDKRYLFYGKFICCSAKKFKKFTKYNILVRDVHTIDGEYITDHLWLHFTENPLAPLKVEAEALKNKNVLFNGYITTYFKGYLPKNKKYTYSKTIGYLQIGLKGCQFIGVFDKKNPEVQKQITYFNKPKNTIKQKYDIISKEVEKLNQRGELE